MEQNFLNSLFDVPCSMFDKNKVKFYPQKYCSGIIISIKTNRETYIRLILFDTRLTTNNKTNWYHLKSLKVSCSEISQSIKFRLNHKKSRNNN